MENFLLGFKRIFGKQTNNERRSRLPFCLMLVGFMVLVALRNTIALDYPVVILSVYAVIMAFLCDRDEIVAFGIACIPLSPAFYYDTVLAMLILVYIVKYPKTLRSFRLWALIPFVLMMGWELWHEIAYGFSGMNYFYAFMTLGFSVFIVCAADRKLDFGLISRVLAVSTVFCCLMVLLRMLIAKDFDFAALFGNRWFRFGRDAVNIGEPISYVLRYNPNGLGAICNLSIAGLLLRMKRQGFNLLDFSLSAILALLGLLTQSRAFLLTFAVMVLLFALTVQSGALKRLRNLGVLVCIGAVGVGIVWLVFPFVIEHIFARLGEADISNGRNDLFAWYNEYLVSDSEHLWFGTGLQDIVSRVNNSLILGIDNCPHNGIQELVLVWGIPGLLLFCGLIIFIICSAKKMNRKMSLMGFIPLIMIFVDGMFGQIITSGATKIMLCFAFVALATDFSDAARIKDKNEKIKLRHAELMTK